MLYIKHTNATMSRIYTFFNLKHKPLSQAYKFIQHVLSMQSMKKSIIAMFYLDDENL